MSTFLLVHGAFHGGWCWTKLSPLLRAAGYEVHAPTLTGLGERSHLLNRTIDLDTHIKDIVNLLVFEDLTDAIIVGHSYGGMVIAGVAQKVPDRLGHLVYLDAITPEDGHSALDCIKPETAALFRRLAFEKGDGWLLPCPSGWTFGVTEGNEVNWLMQNLTPHPLATFEQKLSFRNPLAMALPKTFIWCNGSARKNVREDWPMLPPSFPSGWGCYEIKTGHDAMITAPDELARTLTAVAAMAS